MFSRLIAGALVVVAFAAGWGSAAPPAAAHLFEQPQPPFCQTCAGEYLRWRRVFEETRAWHDYQRELREVIPFSSPYPYYGVRSYFNPEPVYFRR